MRAILVKDGKGPAENLYLGEEETPSPKDGQVLVKVGEDTFSFVALNYADITAWSGFAGQGQRHAE